MEAYNTAVEIEPDLYEAWYNLAGLYSVKKEKDNALKFLRIAIDKGCDDLTHIKNDKDMDFIRNEKEFKEIIDSM